MSRLYDIREALAASIVAADIGWAADSIIIKRQTDLWNDVATVVATNKHGAALFIGVAEGTRTDERSLEMELTVPLTILVLPQTLEGATPEEDLWEALVEHVDDLTLGQDHYSLRFRFKSFTDVEIRADGGTEYLGRQTVFTKKLSL